MFCSNCGAQLADDAKFCLNCGTKVAEETPISPVVTPTPVVGATPPNATTEAVQFNDAFQINEPSPAVASAPKKPKLPVWVIVLIIVLSLGVLGAAGYLIYDNFFADSYSDSDDDDEADKKKDKSNSSDKTSSGETSSDNTSSGNTSNNSPSGNNSQNETSSDTPSNTTSNLPSGTKPVVRPVNSAYTAFFRDNGITEDPTPSAITRCDTYQVYAHEVMDGVVEKTEAGYNDGLLTNMCNIVYYPYSFLAEQWGGEEMVTEQNLNTLITAWKQQFDPVDKLDFATVEYIKESDLIKIVINYTNLDNTTNCQKVFGTSGTKTEAEHKTILNSYGYIEKFTD